MTTLSEFFTPSRGLFVAVCLWTLLAGSACGDETEPMSMMPGATVSGTGGPNTAGSAAAGMTGTVTAGTPAPTGPAGAAGSGPGIGAGAAGRGSMSGAAGGGAAGRGPGSGAAGGGMPGAAGGGAAGRGAAGGGAAGETGAAGGGAAGAGSDNGKYNPCPAGMPCKILPLGDSITVGVPGSGGYRIELFNKAVMAGKQITFVGSQKNGPSMVAGMPFPTAYDATSGFTIQQIAGRVPSPAMDDDPHIVLVHIGTNDMYRSPAGAPMQLEMLIDEITMANPEALVVVAKIIPFPGGSGAVTTFNNTIPGIVDERAKAGKHVIMVDQFMGFPTSELADMVHPTMAGYARMAGVWWEAIKDFPR